MIWISERMKKAMMSTLALREVFRVLMRPSVISGKRITSPTRNKFSSEKLQKRSTRVRDVAAF